MGLTAFRVWVVFGSHPSQATTVLVDGVIRLIDGEDFVDTGATLARLDQDWHRSSEAAWTAAVRTLEDQAKRLLEQAASIRRKECLDAACPSA